MHFVLPRLIILFFFVTTMRSEPSAMSWDAPGAGNPILPGYYADPSLVTHDGRFFIYATLDPWGGETLGCWESSDFKNWTFRELDWPTKQACTSPTSQGAMVWAPSVVRGADGRFFMYVSVGSEVWVGSAAHPLGPWSDALGGRPLIPGNYKPGYHMIDAEAFIDDDGSAYLYWGSGWNWTNGRCFAVKLKADMVSFDGEPREVTPANYFEAPFMVKQGGRYFLMYSNGNTTKDTYEVRYAVGDDALGPFREVPGGPVLATDAERGVVSPGHHAVFQHGGKHFIAYHRHRMPYIEGEVFRQLCVDALEFSADGRIEKIHPTHEGPALVRERESSDNLALARQGARVTASSIAGDGINGPERAIDDNYATRWAPEAGEKGAWLQLDMGAVKPVARNVFRFEYAWKKYAFALEASVDGSVWKTLVDCRETGGVSGSPVVIESAVEARYLRIVFPGTNPGDGLAVIEWRVF